MLKFFHNFNHRKVLHWSFILFLLLGLGSSIYLAQRSQDIEERAQDEQQKAALTFAAGDWHLLNWNYRQSFNTSQLRPNNLAFISIPGTSQIFSRSKDDGSDIRVVDSNGGSLPFVRKEWSKQHKKGLIVTRLNTASNVVYIYTGNPNTNDAQSPNQVYLVYESFPGTTPSGWTILNNPGGNSVNIKPTSWIPSWTIPLFSGTQTVNIGPGAIFDDGTIVAATVNTGEIKQSNDWGRNWQTINANPFDRSANPYTPIPRLFYKDSANNLYISLDGTDAVFRSSDRGWTWLKVLDFNNPRWFFNCCSCSPESCGLNQCMFRCKTSRSMTEFNNGKLLTGSYTVTQFNWEKSSCIFKSEPNDKGQVWSKVWNDTSGRHIHFVTADPYHPGRAYASMGDDPSVAKIVRSDDYGEHWYIVKPEPAEVPTANYYQPTAVAFDPTCRLYGGDNVWDPVIHKSCENDEKNFEVVFRPRNQYGLYYWEVDDAQENHYFGFIGKPEFAKTEMRLAQEAPSFVIATSTNGGFWQRVSDFGLFTASSLGVGAGTFGASNFMNNTSIIATAEKKPYLLKVETNIVKHYLEAKPGASLELNLPSLQGYESVVLEFTMAMKSSSVLGPNDPIPTSRSLILADGSGNTQAGIVIQARDGRPDLWYIYTDSNVNSWTGRPFSLNTWIRVRYKINLSGKTWQLCLPEYNNYCGNELSLSNASSLPSKLILRSEGSIITNILMDISLGANTPGTNIVTAGAEEEVPTATLTPIATPTQCPNPSPPTLNSPSNKSSFPLSSKIDLIVNPIAQKCGSNPAEYEITFTFNGNRWTDLWNGTSWPQTGPYNFCNTATWWVRSRYFDTYYNTYRTSGNSLAWDYDIVCPTPTNTPTPTPTPCQNPSPPILTFPTHGASFSVGSRVNLVVNPITQRCEGNGPEYQINFLFRGISYLSPWDGTSWNNTGPYNFPGTAVWKARSRYWDSFYKIYRESSWSNSWIYNITL